jgi:CheY-like chemotaxis protein
LPFFSTCIDHTKNFSDVLVIDDQEVDLLIATKLIASTGFFEKIITFTTVQSALEYLMASPADEKPDAIFTDLEMSVQNGYDFLQAILENPKLIKSGCHIYILSSSTHWQDKEKISQSSIVRKHLCKPLTI